MGKRYREMQVRTASPVGLVVQLYDAAIGKLRLAKEHHDAGHVAERASMVSLVLAILAELRGALDHEKGGDISRNLDALYLFAADRIVEFNLSGRREACDEALTVLEPLRSAWVEIAQRPPEVRTAGVG